MPRATFGLILANRAVVLGAIPARDLIELSQQAEASGAFDTLWVGDSLLAQPRLRPAVGRSRRAVRRPLAPRGVSGRARRAEPRAGPRAQGHGRPVQRARRAARRGDPDPPQGLEWREGLATRRGLPV